MKNKIPYFLKTLCLGLHLILILSLMALGQDSTLLKPAAIDGVYEFVSQQTTVTKPRKESRTLSAPEWLGTWHLSQGHFSTILMRKKRTLFAQREKYDEDYDSFGGTFTIEDRTLTLIPIYALRPGNQDRPIRLEFELKEDTLILTQFLQPIMEDIRQGTIVTILRKRNSERIAVSNPEFKDENTRIPVADNSSLQSPTPQRVEPGSLISSQRRYGPERAFEKVSPIPTEIWESIVASQDNEQIQAQLRSATDPNEWVDSSQVHLNHDGEPDYVVVATKSPLAGFNKTAFWIFLKEAAGFRSVFSSIAFEIEIMNTGQNGTNSIRVFNLSKSKVFEEVFEFDGNSYRNRQDGEPPV